ncbi:hypothetical protein ABEG10_38150 (plasmid) [Burkholderia cenocepacia]|uniref:hypothetical protein n=1 Tax=Burkholderia cenocepacia TaxID=95486 RepID=UPI0020A21DCB|nr:hypothetical protein [Burkholderia cenocepacia]MCO8402789.1 hypothetical protein [Burkholderia cenocepacia]MCO8415028.1 hypothetical protein [Burkholderia cenocepacia]MCO8423076.1 hypothetical protein [Burkholderia cenocepacia]MCO8474775.1 hypothetical protein [Burkholderia cenocepacia]MCO8482045.1 hypothetical protein [Burkholderia cenocepacia]
MSEKLASSDAFGYSETNAEAIEKALYCLKHGELESVENWLGLLHERIGDGKSVGSGFGNRAAVAAIQYALGAEDGIVWLSLWNEGEFDRCREGWPDAEDDCYIGADLMHPETQRLIAIDAGESSGSMSAKDSLTRMLLAHAWKVDVKRRRGGNGIRRIVLDLREGTTMAPWAVDEVLQQIRDFCESAQEFRPGAPRSGDSQ